jgi:lipoprotein-releasing system permease protein
MRLPFELLLSLRYLKPKRTFVSVITVISTIGVTLGVAVLIIVMSVMSGFDQDLHDKILGFNPHIKVYSRSGEMRDYEKTAENIRNVEHVRAVAPFTLGQVWMETQSSNGASQGMAPYLRGIEADLEEQVSVLPSSIIEGQFDVSGRGLLIGTVMARNFHLRVGDVVALYSPSQLQKMKLSQEEGQPEAILADNYEIKGIFDVGFFEYNSTFLITSMLNFQELFDMDESTQGLLVMLDDPQLVTPVAEEIKTVLGSAYQTSTWMQENSQIVGALAVEKNVMFYILFLIMIVAGFGIANALITFVFQKTREIGLLKAVGATRLQILFIFLSQSLMVGVIGVICGFSLGMTAIAFRNEFLQFMNRMTGFELFPAELYFFSKLPALIIPSDIIMICGGSLLICLLSGILPAAYASRQHPVTSLRHE